MSFTFEFVADSSQASSAIRKLEADLNRLEAAEERAAAQMRGVTDAMSRGSRGASTAFDGLTAALQREQRMLQAIHGPAREYATDLQLLDKLLKQGSISADEYTKHLARVRGEYARTQAPTGVPAVAGAGAMGGLKGGLAALGVGIGAKEIGDLANEYQNLQNRLRYIAGGDGQKVAELFARTQEVARNTRSDLSATTEAFVRMSLATKEMGLSQSQVFTLTERLNKAIILSGATSNEATAGMIQLSQGLASGALRGDELRSVLEQLPAVADVIAKGLNVTRGKLRELGADGKITAEVIVDAFNKAGSELDAAFGNTLPTISQSFIAFKNELITVVGEFNEATGASRIFATVLGAITGALHGIANVAGAVIGPLRELVDTAGIDIGAGTLLGFIAGGPLGAAIGTTIETLGDYVGAWDSVTDSVLRAAQLEEQAAKNRGKMAIALFQGGQALVDALNAQQAYNMGLMFGAKAADDFLGSLQKLHAEQSRSIFADVKKGENFSGKDMVKDLLSASDAAYDAATKKIKAHKHELTDMEKVLKELRGPEEELQRKLVALETLFAKGTITVEEYNRALDKWLDRTDEMARRQLSVDFDNINKAFTGQGFGTKSLQDDVADLKKYAEDLQKQFADAAEKYEKERVEGLTKRWHQRIEEYEEETRERAKILADLWQPLGTALGDVFMTGRFELDSFAEAMEKTLSQLAIKILMTTLLMKGLGLGASYTNALGGDAGLGKLLGFASGGRFTVAGNGGTDSQVVAFRATPGERVSVETPSQQSRDAGGGAQQMAASGPTVIHNVFDKRALLPVLRSTEGRNEILNVIRENPGAVRAALQK